MKDHEKRQIIEDLVVTARKYVHAEQLRDCIAYALGGVFSALDEATARAERAEAELLAAQKRFKTQCELWEPVDAYARKHPGMQLGASIPEHALALLQERDKLAAQLKKAMEQEPVAHVVNTERCTVWWNDKFTHISQCPPRGTALYAYPIPAPSAQDVPTTTSDDWTLQVK